MDWDTKIYVKYLEFMKISEDASKKRFRSRNMENISKKLEISQNILIDM